MTKFLCTCAAFSLWAAISDTIKGMRKRSLWKCLWYWCQQHTAIRESLHRWPFRPLTNVVLSLHDSYLRKGSKFVNWCLSLNVFIIQFFTYNIWWSYRTSYLCRLLWLDSTSGYQCSDVSLSTMISYVGHAVMFI